MTTFLHRRSAETTEWGPAKHDPEHPLHASLGTGAAGVALRDGDDARPDDN